MAQVIDCCVVHLLTFSKTVLRALGGMC